MIIGPNEPLPTPPAPYGWARVDKEPVADFEQIENCISFAENEGYEEWAKGAKAELELYRARCSAVEQERDGLLADWKAMAESLEADHLEEVRALTAERDEWRRWFELRQASSAAAGARAEVALQERDEARERHIAGLAATRGRIKSLKHDRSRLRSQVRDLTIRAEAAEQALREIAAIKPDLNVGAILIMANYKRLLKAVELARAALAGREEGRMNNNTKCATCGHPKYMHGPGGCGHGEKRPYCSCIVFVAPPVPVAGREEIGGGG